MDKFKKIILFLLKLERTDPRAIKNQEISKMVNIKNSMVHTNLKELYHENERACMVTLLINS